MNPIHGLERKYGRRRTDDASSLTVLERLALVVTALAYLGLVVWVVVYALSTRT